MFVPLMGLAVALGGAAAAALLLAAMLVRQLRPHALPGIAFAAGAGGAVIAVAGRVQGHGQEWAYGGVAQAAMLAAVCAVAATLAPRPGTSDPRSGAARPDGAGPEPSASEAGGAHGPSAGAADGARAAGGDPGPATSDPGSGATGPEGTGRAEPSASEAGAAGGVQGPATSDPSPAPAAEPPASHRATIGRSIALFRGFLHEQSDPDRFYSMLAADSARQLRSYVDLNGALVLDVGGGPGYFAAAFRDAGATYVGLDPAVGDFAAAGAPVTGMVRGAGTALPVRSGVVDVCYSSNVLEHVSTPEAMLDEMARVTRPGGTVFVSFTPWLSPWGGHETAPWHYLGGERARRRYVRREGREPKNRYRHTLFPTTAAGAVRWARAARRDGRVEIVDVLPRYHPGWAHWTARLPVLREFLTWNFTMILRREASQGSQSDVTR